MLQLSPSAIQAFKALLERTGKGKRAIRVFTMGSGCCGPAVGMDLVEKGQPDDLTLEQDGLVVHLEQQAATALAGVTIEFDHAGPRKGFILRNPAGDGCCG